MLPANFPLLIWNNEYDSSSTCFFFYQVIYVTNAISNCSVNVHYLLYLNALFFYIKSIACKCSEMLFLHKSKEFVTRLICKDKPTNREILIDPTSKIIVLQKQGFNGKGFLICFAWSGCFLTIFRHFSGPES